MLPAETAHQGGSKINNVVTSPPAIEELSSSDLTLLKMNSSGDGDRGLNRVISSSQPQLHGAAKQSNQMQSLVSLNNESSVSLQSAGQTKVQNNVNEVGRSVEGGGHSSSWRNITRSDDSFIHNQTDPGIHHRYY